MRYHIMDHTGHSEEAFTRGDIVSLSEASTRFAELTARGMSPFRADGDGRHTRLKAFDAEADVVLFVPNLVGG